MNAAVTNLTLSNGADTSTNISMANGTRLLEQLRQNPEYIAPFEVQSILATYRMKNGLVTHQTTVKFIVDGKIIQEVADGEGTVDAFNKAFNKAIEPSYPNIKEIDVTGYSVSLVDPESGTAAKTKASFEITVGGKKYNFESISVGVVEASIAALFDAYELGINQQQKLSGK